MRSGATTMWPSYFPICTAEPFEIVDTGLALVQNGFKPTKTFVIIDYIVGKGHQSSHLEQNMPGIVMLLRFLFKTGIQFFIILSLQEIH